MRHHTLVALLGGLLIALNPAHAAENSLNWVGCGISKLGFMQDLAAAYETRSGVKVNLEGGGATKGIRQVSAGESHLGGSCRMPLVYKEKGGRYVVESAESRVKMIPLGWDALVVIAHKDNQMVSSITREQLKAVLRGEITTWRGLGADNDQPINLYIRQGTISGVGLTLRQQLFDNVNEQFSAKATELPSSGKIEQAVEQDPLALAVSGISSSRHRDLRMLPLDAVEPTMENMKKGEYVLYRLLFLVAPAKVMEQPESAAFVRFAQSAEGTTIIEKAGTLPYRYGLRLLSGGASPDYLHNLEVIEQSGLYSPFLGAE